eukprot:2420396-Heterocapsa_arctica.AAC.1
MNSKEGGLRLEVGLPSRELIEKVWGPTRCNLDNVTWARPDNAGEPPTGFEWKWMIYDPEIMVLNGT